MNGSLPRLIVNRTQLVASVEARSSYDPSEPHYRDAQGGPPTCGLLGSADVQWSAADQPSDRTRAADGVAWPAFAPQDGSERLREAVSDYGSDAAQRTIVSESQAAARRQHAENAA